MYRKNTSSQFVGFAMVTTAGAADTGATVTVKRSIDGGAQASATGSVTNLGGGQYVLAMSQADTNGNNITFLFTATGDVPVEKTIVTTACDPTVATNFGITALPTTAVTTNASLLTSGTSTDQLSVSSGKVILQATQTGVTIPTVTTVTNQLTAAQIATGVWQDATGTDFTTVSSIGKSLYTSGNAPGAASGLAIVGSNMGTVTSVTGSVGSVTGAVGSVTGNVGGSVASVTGAVGSVTGNVGGNVTGSVGSISGVSFPTNFGSMGIDASGNVSIAVPVKKNVALSHFAFLMTDSTNHAPATGLTVSVTRSIDGGAFAAGTLGAVAEVANGIYQVNFGSGDLNGNVIILRATATGADDRFERLVTYA